MVGKRENNNNNNNNDNNLGKNDHNNMLTNKITFSTHRNRHERRLNKDL